MAHDWQKDVYTLTYHFQGKRRIFLMIVVLLLLVGLLTGGLPAEAARLENPGEGQVYSGIGVISGWKCEAAGPLTIRFNGGPPVPLVYGSERPDTRSVCGDANNGFVALWNWGNLHTDTETARATVRADTHTARVYDNGVMFAETTFEVGTLGVAFLRGFEGEPGSSGSTGSYSLVWNENTQHFEVGTGRFWGKGESAEQPIEAVERRDAYRERREQLEQRQPGWHTEAARLENPGDGQLYSGIGAISGWKCEATVPLTIRFNDGRSIPLVYGSARPDTRSVCGDANNGFVAIWNWGNLGDGIHTARVYDNGVAFAETTFQVGTLGVAFWDGVHCLPARPDACWEGESFSSTLTRLHQSGYDGTWWAAPGTSLDPWDTYFTWNANTQHFEAFARRRYQPSEPPEPPEAWRWQDPSFEDRPDDFDGPQIHVYHAEPRDARGSRDMIGYLGATVQAAQRWLAARTYRGRAFRIDTYQGIPDVTTLPLTVTTAEMQAYNPETLFDVPILPGGLSLGDIGSHDPNKLHVVFIEAPPAISDSPGAICGAATSGVAVVIAGRPFLPIHGHSYCGKLSLVFLHEVFHLLGAVHPDAPHSDGTSHIADKGLGTDEASFDEDGRPLRGTGLPKRGDLMQPRLSNSQEELDIGSDDYYFHPEKTPDWPPPHYDTVDSPYFTAGPWRDRTWAASSHALRAAPPEGPPVIAPDNQAEAGPWRDRTRAASSHALRAAPPEGPPVIAPDNQAEAGPWRDRTRAASSHALRAAPPEGQDGHSSGGWCLGVVD